MWHVRYQIVHKAHSWFQHSIGRSLPSTVVSVRPSEIKDSSSTAVDKGLHPLCCSHCGPPCLCAVKKNSLDIYIKIQILFFRESTRILKCSWVDLWMEGKLLALTNLLTARMASNLSPLSFITSGPSCPFIFAARQSDSFWSGICHPIRMGRAGG